jgi:acetyl-CoA carboxylase biotin carboxyl carrier protein
MARENSDLQKIKELIEIMKENDLVEVEIEHDDDKIFLKRAQPQPSAVTAVPIVGSNIPLAPVASDQPQAFGLEAAASAAQEQEELVEIKASIVGTFYAAPSPDSDPFVEVDDHVEAQTVVCIIEAMKVMNEIKAETSGTIAEVLVTNGQAVEYGQVLFKVRPD